MHGIGNYSEHNFTRQILTRTMNYSFVSVDMPSTVNIYEPAHAHSAFNLYMGRRYMNILKVNTETLK